MLSKAPLALYPETTPNSEHCLKVSDLHTLYVASYGNKAGIPVIVLHGGPGSGTTPYFTQFFNPKKYHIILMDQRGSGKSTPKSEMKDNTTQLLIDDIEQLRKFFNIEKWAVFGGSWGSALALLYAETYPQNVIALIVCGIFLARENDISAFVRDGSPAALSHKNEWDNFKSATTRLIERANMSELSVVTDPIYEIYYELMQHQDHEIRNLAGSTLMGWERFISNLIPNPDYLIPSNNEDRINSGLTEATYFKNNCFIEPNQILNDIARLKNIPVYIVQGTYDMVCQPYRADELEAALLAINVDKDLIVRKNCLAGHSPKDKALANALVDSLDQLARALEMESGLQI